MRHSSPLPPKTSYKAAHGQLGPEWTHGLGSVTMRSDTSRLRC